MTNVMLSGYSILEDSKKSYQEKLIIRQSFHRNDDSLHSLEQLLRFLNSIDFSEEECKRKYAFYSPDILSHGVEHVSENKLIELLEMRTYQLAGYNKMFLDIEVKGSYINFMYKRLIELRMNHLGETLIDPANSELEFFKHFKILMPPSLYYFRYCREYRNKRYDLGVFHNSYEVIPFSKYKDTMYNMIFDSHSNIDQKKLVVILDRVTKEAVSENLILEYEGIVHLIMLKASSLNHYPWNAVHPGRNIFPGVDAFQNTMEEIYQRTFIEEDCCYPRLLFA